MNGFGIDLGERDGFWYPDGLGLRLLSRSIGEPPKDDRTERVPYSNVTHDFDRFCKPSYGERTLVYKYDFLCRDRRSTQFLLSQIRTALQWQGCRDLHDSAFPDYHFEVRAPAITAEDGDLSVHYVTFTFKAAPAMLPNCVPALLESGKRYPDLNDDGHITAADAAIILTAAENIAAGEPSGLTPAQELLADADLDGTITEADSVLVLQFSAAAAAGDYEDNLQGWLKYLRRYLSLEGALY